MPRKSLSTTFREAYELLATEQERYSCDAVIRAIKQNGAPGALLFYREHFTPSLDSPEHYWLRNTGLSEAERREWRLTALAFAAAMTKGT